jgi:hypothetical protein
MGDLTDASGLEEYWRGKAAAAGVNAEEVSYVVSQRRFF